MSLGKKSEEWIAKYSYGRPWAAEIIKKYGLNLDIYDLDNEVVKSINHHLQPDIANLIEDIHFLKTFDAHVGERLPENFSSILEVGTGMWTYSFALATFFHHYNPGASIIGIERDIFYMENSLESIQRRSLSRVEAKLADIKSWPGRHDIVVNICPNLVDHDSLFGSYGYEVAKDFFQGIWKSIKGDGLFVLGLGSALGNRENAVRAIQPFFKDIVSSRNPYSNDKSYFLLEDIITAKPKLPIETAQS